ncbi:MAG: serine/threonine-protein kinase, partial [Myxococcota bacterium]
MGEVDPNVGTPTSLGEGRYRVEAVLGQGGMATVYRAFDTRLDCYRAIKVLAPGLAAKDALRRRFETEARTMAKLHHPNIVTVHDVALDGEQVFIVMEIVDGGSLKEHVIDHGGLAPRIACAAMVPVLAAMQYAHNRGVVHRDIKPHNILLTPEGVPKVTDFGIAYANDTDHSMTRTGTVMGTWAYMAPEQRTSARRADSRSDIYAAGAMFYAILTNREPFDLYSAELREELFRDVSGPLAEVIQKATRYKPEERYATAGDMAQAVRAAHDALPPDPPGAIPLGTGLGDDPSTGEVSRAVTRSLPPGTEPTGPGPGATIVAVLPDGELSDNRTVLPGPDTLTGTEEPAPPAPARPARVLPVAAIVGLAGLALVAVLSLGS